MSGKTLVVILAAAGLLFAAANLVKHSVFNINIEKKPSFQIGNVRLKVEIADTAAARAKGLSGRAALAENSGMLFVFDTTDYHNFWMKGMNFPLDIVWLNDNWRVIDITANISPKDFPTTYQPRLPARYVLEVNSGFTTNHQITIGTQMVSK